MHPLKDDPAHQPQQEPRSYDPDDPHDLEYHSKKDSCLSTVAGLMTIYFFIPAIFIAISAFSLVQDASIFAISLLISLPQLFIIYRLLDTYVEMHARNRAMSKQLYMMNIKLNAINHKINQMNKDDV